MPMDEGGCQQTLANVAPMSMLWMETFLGREGGTEREERGEESKTPYARLVHTCTCSHHQNSGTGVCSDNWTVQIYVSERTFQILWIGKFSSLKVFRRWPTMTKLDARKFFNVEVRIALLEYMKPVHHGLPDHRRLFFFSHVTNSKRVHLAPCVACTYISAIVT